MNQTIRQIIDTHITAEANITDVISLRPGLGKTQYIIYRMSEALKNNSGLLVVTDSVDRLQEIAEGKSVNDEIAKYIDRNQHRIALFTSDNYREEIQTANYKPIICMTTQRFFHQYKPGDINNLIKNNQHQIKQILIDEQPYITEVKSIGIKHLVQIDETINTALTNLTDQEDKRQLIESFNMINSCFRKAFEDAENRNESGYYHEYYFSAELQSVSNTLLILTEKYKSELNKYNPDVVNYLQTISHIADDGGMVVSQKRKSKDDINKYENHISAVIDYRKWFTEINSKIVIFDGTALKLNPLYDTDYFNIVDCRSIEERIPKLTINIIDISASKTKLIKEPLHLQAIIDYLKAEPQQTQAVFTYKDIESQFSEITDKTAHFGDIKGLNKYNDLINITQVGLNRYSDYDYQFLCGYKYASKIKPHEEVILSDSAIEWYKSQGLTVPKQSTVKSTTRIISNKHLINYRNRMILSDIVQNVFRSKIRNQDNSESITYNLIFSYSASNTESKTNNELVRMIQNYFIPIGATVNLIDTPNKIHEYKIIKRNNKSDSVAQRILDWLFSKPKGYEFTPREIQQDLGIESNIYYSSIKANKSLAKILKSMKVKDGLYRI